MTQPTEYFKPTANGESNRIIELVNEIRKFPRIIAGEDIRLLPYIASEYPISVTPSAVNYGHFACQVYDSSITGMESTWMRNPLQWKCEGLVLSIAEIAESRKRPIGYFGYSRASFVVAARRLERLGVATTSEIMDGRRKYLKIRLTPLAQWLERQTA